jgi:flagellar assembly protein FliH
MSSKLLRASDPVAATAIAWQPGNVGDLLTFPPRRVNAKADENDVDTLIKEAYQRGRHEAEAAANQRAVQKMEPVMAGVSRMLQELAGLRKKFRADAEQDTVRLAIAIARRVLHRELMTDPDAILGLVIAAFQKLNARETHRLRVSPSDAAAIQENRSRMELPPGLEISPDASLAPGSAVFETSRGELDASIGTQLAEIDRGFADLVRKQAR